jgi:hypothetical protein
MVELAIWLVLIYAGIAFIYGLCAGQGGLR